MRDVPQVGVKYIASLFRWVAVSYTHLHTALSLIVETGEFERFAKGNVYAAYLGLAPGERSVSYTHLEGFV